MKKFKNKKIIQQLLKIKNLLNQANKKKIFFEQDLTLANYEILKIINDNKVTIISEIQKFLVDSLPSLTQKTNKLVKLKYISKNKDDIDPRKNILRITKKGKKSLSRIEKKIDLVSMRIFLKYSEEEKELFLKILKDLEKKLTRQIK